MIKINGKTKILGVIGDPVEHTASPKMHNKALLKRELNFSYLPIHVSAENLEKAIKGMRAMNFEGINVTVPHKVNVMSYLDVVSEDAKLIGAVNTVKNVDGILTGYNTDGQGFVNDFESKFDCSVEGKSVVLLGAGGASRAIAVALVKNNVSSLVIANRTIEKALLIKDVIANLNSSIIVDCCLLSDVHPHINNSDILVNSTSLGMLPEIDRTPVDVDLINKSLMFYDIIYNPAETALMKALSKKGSRCVNGKGMLAGQGAIAFEIFTGCSVSVTEMEGYL